ncbi:hypothetical protein [Bradyrhizobium shewense]|uniref:hypothetical protein n=1 Tax=Bradyrhizobium shewense TaxID=1761772 RepID=UPI00101ADEC2|nr:hypothetical protein [Bradyrhizobium shewense]
MAKAFSSEVDTGSRQENASKEEILAGPEGGWRQPPFRTGRFGRDQSPERVVAGQRLWTLRPERSSELSGTGERSCSSGQGGLQNIVASFIAWRAAAV